MGPEAPLMFPGFDPIAIQIGPFAIRWYALGYVGSLLVGWQYVRWLARRGMFAVSQQDIDDILVWMTFGVLLGGRLGYVLFYKPDYYLHNPGEILAIWAGGMSFHGGVVGVILALYIFARRRGLGPLDVGDAVAPALPIGMMFGRVANFINGELVGRVSDVPWAVVFPHAGPLPRHPSQLYQAGLEGLGVFAVMTVLVFATRARFHIGMLTGCYLVAHGLTRVIGELFREPDAHLGFLFAGATMGQLLSVPMILVGVVLIRRATRVPPREVR